MKITVAGNKKEYEDGITVAELIVKENVENPEYVTVTVNDDFVERDDFETTKLNEGDAVEFLYFMGGGAYQWRLLMNSLKGIHATLF